MIQLFCFFFFLASPAILLSQDVDQLIKQAQQQESSFHENEAFLSYAQILKQQPDQLIALCKCSELSSRIGARQAGKDKMQEYFIAARNYASAALRRDPRSSDANFVMALALGRLSLIAGTRERIVLARDIKKYAEISIRLDPSNFKPYHVLGKWNYEVSDLNVAERSIAKIIYGGLPPASLKQCVFYFEKSRSLNPAFLLNYLELARAYHRDHDNPKAIEQLQTLLKLPNMIYDDTRVKTTAMDLLKQWQ
jgi:tetratricopeptide (TPR) repeat protein